MDNTLDENALKNIWGGMKQTWQQNKQAMQQAWQTGKANFQTGYQQGKQSADQVYEKYAQQAQNALAKVKNIEQVMSQKTGVPLPLATAMLAAGATGGASAIPVAALTYFARKPVTALASKGFDAAWNAGQKMMQKQPAPQLQPEHFSFKEWLEIQEAGFNMANAAQFAGRMAGKAVGYSQGLGNTIKGRVQEIAKSITNNPKDVAKLAFLVGVGAMTGGVLGNLSRQAVDQITQSVQDYVQGVPAEEINWLRNNVVIDQASDAGTQAYKTGDVNMFSEGGVNKFPQSELGEIQPDQYVSTYQTGEEALTPASVDSKYMDFVTRKLADNPDVNQGAFDFTRVLQGDVKDPGLANVYRDLAKQMHAHGYLQHLGGMEADKELSQLAYGHSAAQEIKNRLASPDNMTIPGAMGGAAGAYRDQRKRR